MLYTELLFFFSALGVFNSLLLGIYLLFLARKIPKRFLLLALIVILLSIRVGVSCFYFFQQFIDASLIQLGLSANLLSGVFLYEYLGREQASQVSVPRSSLIHILMATSVLVIGGLSFPFAQHPQIWDFHIRYLLHTGLSIYLVASTIRIRNIAIKWIQKASLHPMEWEQLIVYMALVWTCLGFAISLYSTYVLGPILYSLIFYSAAILYVFYGKKQQPPSPKYAHKKIAPKEAKPLIDALTSEMESTQVYKDPNLKISGLAKTLTISSHQLSQLLNDNLGKNFSQFINEYRIQASKQLLLSHPHLTIEAIAYEVGFNSKSSFYGAFKQFEGGTPAAFRQGQLAKRSSKS
ncbi:MAG: helix-turn-helix domain-containing protein [Bacteroidota bacterium]